MACLFGGPDGEKIRSDEQHGRNRGPWLQGGRQVPVGDYPDYLDSRWQGGTGPSGGSGSDGGCLFLLAVFVLVPIVLALAFVLVVEDPEPIGKVIGDLLVGILTMSFFGGVILALGMWLGLAVGRVLKALGLHAPGIVGRILHVVALVAYLVFCWFSLLSYSMPFGHPMDKRLIIIALAYVSIIVTAVSVLVMLMPRKAP